MKQKLSGPKGYSLKSVVHSHGWSDLFPFQRMGEDGACRVLLRLGGRVHSVVLSPVKYGFEIESPSKLGAESLEVLSRMFRLEDDLSEFYELADAHNRPWIRENAMGRMLRSQTITEDLVKLIFTTNCSWAMTKKMLLNFCSAFEVADAQGNFIFPLLKPVALKREAFFRNQIRCGYRAKYFPQFFSQLRRGNLDPEAWINFEGSSEALKKEIVRVPGAGPYVADNLLRLIGRHDYLGLDSFVRARLKTLWNRESIPGDSEIQEAYAPFGSYRGLILWCDVTRPENG